MRYATGILVSTLVMAFGCGGNESKTTAERAVPQFHESYNTNQFDAIYQAADDQFRSATSKKDYYDFMSAVRRKLGRAKSSDLQSWNVFLGTSGRRITLVYQTQFDEGQATERFVFVNSAAGIKLLGYNVNSRLLVTK